MIRNLDADIQNTGMRTALHYLTTIDKRESLKNRAYLYVITLKSHAVCG